MKTITQAERLQLIGLHALALRHIRALEDICKCAIGITGDFDGTLETCGHTDDLIWDAPNLDVDEVLARLGVTVADEPPKEAA